MGLCSVYAPLDIRALLLQSLKLKEKEPEDRLPWNSDSDSAQDSSNSEDGRSNNRELHILVLYELEPQSPSLEDIQARGRPPNDSTAYDPEFEGSISKDRERSNDTLMVRTYFNLDQTLQGRRTLGGLVFVRIYHP